MAAKIGTSEEWKTARLDECFDIQQGKQVSKRNREGVNQRPFLRTANVFWGRLDLSELDHMNFTQEEERKFALQKGDLLVCEGGDIGRTAMWNNEVEHCYYQNHLHRLRRKNGNVDENFALFYLQHAFIFEKILAGRANITTIPNLSKSRLSELEISLPGLDQQKTIAHVLITVKDAIAGQEELIAKLKDLKKSMMQHLFTHGTKGEKTKMTEIGEMPESWVVAEFGKFAEFKNGINFSKSQKGSNGIKTIDVFNMYGGKGTKVKLDSLYRVDKKVSDDHVLRKGDLLFVRSSLKLEGIGWTCYFDPITSDEYTFCGFIIRARLNNSRIDSEFLALYFRTELARKLLISGSGKVAITNINQGMLSNIKIPIPIIDEQKNIIKSVYSVDEKIEAAQEKLSNYQNLFKTLLHELMSGERRIKK